MYSINYFILLSFLSILLNFSLIAEENQKLVTENITNNQKLDNLITEGNYNISNLTVSPTNANLLLYSISKRNSDTISSQLVIHNIKTNKYYIITHGGKKLLMRKGVKLTWHPSGKVAIFTSVTSEKNERLFSIRLYQDELNTKYSFKIFELVFIDKINEEALNRDPCFNSDGSVLYFSRKDADTNGFDIFYIEEFNEKLKEKRCGNLEYEVLIEEDFDQIFPKPSPVLDEDDNQLLAYISTDSKAQVNSNKFSYKYYSLNLFDTEEEELYKITSCSGFNYYPFFWAKDGKSIFSLEAKELNSKNLTLMDKNKNEIDLYNYKIMKADFAGFNFIPLTNGKTDILAKNIKEKIFYFPRLKDSDIFLISIYDDIMKDKYSIKLFDKNRWSNRDENFLIPTNYNNSFNPVLSYNVDNKNEISETCFLIQNNKIIKSKLTR